MDMPTTLYIDDDKSDTRGVKNGWYEVHQNGKLGSGPFANREDCLGHINQRQVAISAYHQWAS
jgi:hypothetical protein